jgi:hypothetical protein
MAVEEIEAKMESPAEKPATREPAAEAEATPMPDDNGDGSTIKTFKNAKVNISFK